MNRTTARIAPWIAAVTLSAGLAGSAQAALVAYDGFDYAEGAGLVGQTGGTGWTNTWYKPAANLTPKMVTPGLTFGALEVAGNAATLDDGVTNTVSSIAFRSAGAFNSGDVWVSVLVNPSTTAAAQQFFGIGFFNGQDTTSSAGIQRAPVTPGSVQPWAISGGGVAAPNTGTNMIVGHTYLMVAHFAFNVSGVQDRLDLFIDPTPGAPLPGSPSLTLTSTVANNLDWDRIRFGSANSLGWVVDELRIGTTFADVTPVPEPASMALLAIGGLACTARRQRRGRIRGRGEACPRIFANGHE